MILDDILEKIKCNQEKIAYTIGEKKYSYFELYKYVCNIYNFLISNNKDRKPVIVYGKKEIYMKACFLACSFAGITYVPVDESLPKERIELIIKQVKPFFIIGNYESKECVNIEKKKIYEIMEQNEYNDIQNIYLKPNDIYYIIFTSGSTGIPKGVKVTYKNLDSCVRWLLNISHANNEIILNQAIFSFDLSVADMYLTVASGSEHFILENENHLEFSKTFKELKQSNATMAVLTPSFAELLMIDDNFKRELLPNLNTIIFCGEKLLKKTVEKLFSRFKDIRIINCYGPTECTFAVTSIELTEKNLEENLPVGFPKDDVRIYILDENGNEEIESKVGEILIAGQSVAAGYLDNNNEKFIKFKSMNAYKTGDLGFIKNGVLYYLDRKDNQIKYKGYRIELSDIEKNFYNLPYIENGRVIAIKSAEGVVEKLVAFIKLKNNEIKSIKEIKEDLSNKIPNYMIPNIKIINKFPLNNNGKIDISKLRRLANGG